MSLLCMIPFAASLFAACAPPAPLAVGYAEGDYVLLAPIETAQLANLAVRRGEHVAAGAELARFEQSDAKIGLAEAEATLAQAKAQLENISGGRRPEEIAVLEAQRDTALTEAADAKRSLDRIKDLHKRGIASQAELDQAVTRVELAANKVVLAEANLSVARLPARAGEIEAAGHQVARAEAARDQAAWRLGKRVLIAPSAGRISDVLRNPGDLAGPAAPVLSLLPDGAVRLRLYVPQAALAKVRPGVLLDVRCDGCAAGLKAKVSYVSPDPEFTPPVIYSLENRQKLVFLVEALPEGEATALQPGQIVDVSLADSP